MKNFNVYSVKIYCGELSKWEEFADSFDTMEEAVKCAETLLAYRIKESCTGKVITEHMGLSFLFFGKKA